MLRETKRESETSGVRTLTPVSSPCSGPNVLSVLTFTAISTILVQNIPVFDRVWNSVSGFRSAAVRRLLHTVVYGVHISAARAPRHFVGRKPSPFEMNTCSTEPDRSESATAPSTLLRAEVIK